MNSLSVCVRMCAYSQDGNQKTSKYILCMLSALFVTTKKYLPHLFSAVRDHIFVLLIVFLVLIQWHKTNLGALAIYADNVSITEHCTNINAFEGDFRLTRLKYGLRITITTLYYFF